MIMIYHEINFIPFDVLNEAAEALYLETNISNWDLCHVVRLSILVRSKSIWINVNKSINSF